MLVGICGPSYSGKNELVRYLSIQGFTRLYIRFPNTSASHSPPTSRINASVISNGDTNGLIDRSAPSKSDKFMSSESLTSSMTSEISSHTTFEQDEMPFLAFESAVELLDYATTRWRERFVTTNIDAIETFETLEQRPFFMLLAIQSPISARYNRYKRSIDTEQALLSLENFVEASDRELYSGPRALAGLMQKATLQIINASQSVEVLYGKLAILDLLDDARLRPSWDSYFMQLANLAARRSNCMKRRVGCVLVRGKRVIATGYNGTPRGIRNCNEGGCSRCNSGATAGGNLATCLCLHAEENALLEAGRERVLGEDSVLYCNTCPCLTCTIKIVQMGLNEVVYANSYSMDTKAMNVLSEGGVRIRQYRPPEEGVVII
ncbi:cytidine deaminase-like protein [Lipomyces oligophaga]|uniref:cytidine deaminase-like protein n=1 Tax=Lipomyces oligophaga TaxID=45792 RepID=UPI0034CDDA2E